MISHTHTRDCHWIPIHMQEGEPACLKSIDKKNEWYEYFLLLKDLTLSWSSREFFGDSLVNVLRFFCTNVGVALLHCGLPGTLQPIHIKYVITL